MAQPRSLIAGQVRKIHPIPTLRIHTAPPRTNAAPASTFAGKFHSLICSGALNRSKTEALPRVIIHNAGTDAANIQPRSHSSCRPSHAYP